MFCCNGSKLNATSCNTRPVEVAKVPVKTEAKGFLAFLLIDSRGAERQQKQISNNKGNGGGGEAPHPAPSPNTNKQTKPPNQPTKKKQSKNKPKSQLCNRSTLILGSSAGLSSSPVLPNYPLWTVTYPLDNSQKKRKLSSPHPVPCFLEQCFSPYI